MYLNLDLLYNVNNFLQPFKYEYKYKWSDLCAVYCPLRHRTFLVSRNKYY